MQTEQEEAPEQALATELELVSMIRENPDIFVRHPDLLADMQVPHAAGAATSLIERQVEVLRQKIRNNDRRLCDLMGVARDNERLSNARHALAVSLFLVEIDKPNRGRNPGRSHGQITALWA